MRAAFRIPGPGCGSKGCLATAHQQTPEVQHELGTELMRLVRAAHRSDRQFTWQARSSGGEALSVKAFPAEGHIFPTRSDAFTLLSLIGRLDTLLHAPVGSVVARKGRLRRESRGTAGKYLSPSAG